MSKHFTNKEIENLSQSLQGGLNCAIHKKTKVVYINFFTLEILEETGMGEDELLDEDRDIIENPSDYIEIEKMPSGQAFRIMEDFAEQTNDKSLQNRLIQALERRKPFANFKRTIDNSDEREAWFAFKNERYFNYVKRRLRYFDMEEE